RGPGSPRSPRSGGVSSARLRSSRAARTTFPRECRRALERGCPWSAPFPVTPASGAAVRPRRQLRCRGRGRVRDQPHDRCVRSRGETIAGADTASTRRLVIGDAWPVTVTRARAGGRREGSPPQTSILDRRASSFAGTSPRPARPASNAAMGSAGRWKFAAPTAANLQRIPAWGADSGGLPRGDGPRRWVARGRGGRWRAAWGVSMLSPAPAGGTKPPRPPGPRAIRTPTRVHGRLVGNAGGGRARHSTGASTVGLATRIAPASSSRRTTLPLLVVCNVPLEARLLHAR